MCKMTKQCGQSTYALSTNLFYTWFLCYSIELFQSTCDELADWIKEKDNALNTDDLGKGLQATIALQRKHAVGLKFVYTLANKA